MTVSFLILLRLLERTHTYFGEQDDIFQCQSLVNLWEQLQYILFKFQFTSVLCK